MRTEDTCSGECNEHKACEVNKPHRSLTSKATLQAVTAQAVAAGMPARPFELLAIQIEKTNGRISFEQDDGLTVLRGHGEDGDPLGMIRLPQGIRVETLVAA